MFDTLPESVDAVFDWEWPSYQPYVEALLDRPLTAESLDAWLADWSHLSNLIGEVYALHYVATTLDTTDEGAEARFNTFLTDVYNPGQSAENALRDRLLTSGLEPDGFEMPLRRMRAQAELFREENLPLQVEERKLAAEYNRLIAGQTVEWDGEEKTLTQLTAVSQERDRARREQAWRLAAARVLEDREAIDDVWRRLMDVRRQIYQNAGLPDYRAYAWINRLRFDYTPEDAEQFHAAIEEVVVPAAARAYQRRAALMGVDALRPWDVNVNVMRTTDFAVDAAPGEPVRAFGDAAELEAKAAAVFDAVDPALGGHFKTLRDASLLDLANYRGKAPGAYCMTYPARRLPFIFQNATGVAGDVSTLLHETGHAFHVFEKRHLPYHQQWATPMEFNEVASMAMELLAQPYLAAEEEGFFNREQASRALVDHLEEMLIFWPYMAVVDAFQHWAYTNHAAASDPANADAKWAELWDRFIVGVDWGGLDDEKATGWQRKLHIFRYPFYYIEYGLAQLGAAQVWRNAREDQAGAVAQYRQALALGGTASLPELFSAAGAAFGMDVPTVRGVVEFIEGVLGELTATA